MDVFNNLDIIIRDSSGLKERLKATLGTEKFKAYWKSFEAFMQFKLTKKEFDMAVVDILGTDHCKSLLLKRI